MSPRPLLLALLAACTSPSGDTGADPVRAALEAHGAVEVEVLTAGDTADTGALPERLVLDGPAALDALLADPAVRGVRLLGPARGGGRGPVAAFADGPDTTPPTGTITLGGGAEWAISTATTVTVDAADDSGLARMCFSLRPTLCTSWVRAAATGTVRLASTQGEQTVYAFFEDTLGNVSTVPATDTISLDSVRPTEGTFTATAESATVHLSWADFADAGSGLAGYRLVQEEGTRSPATACRSGTVVYEGTDTAVTLTGREDGKTYAYRLCALDVAGNISTGLVTSARPAPEYDPPTGGAVSINAGAAWTRTGRVTLSFSASDPAGVTHVCVSNVSTCTAWRAYSNTMAWSLSGGAGTRSVNVFFRDAYGNATTVPATDSIGVDLGLPTGGVVVATPSAGQIALSWSGFTDAASGVARYRVVRRLGSTPPSACNGTPAWEGTDTSTTLTGLTDGQTYSLRVCAVDAAGNVSRGAIARGRPAPEYDAPTGASIVLDDDAAWATAATVRASVSAADPSGVAHMCIGTSASTCAAWVPFTATRNIRVSRSSGTETLYAWFRDTYGNATSTPVSDGIGVDRARPLNGSATVSATGTTATVLVTGFTDAQSGIRGYRLRGATGTVAPASCLTGGSVSARSDSETLTLTGLLPGRAYAFRVCAIDGGNNLSTGTTVTVTTAPEGDAPGDAAIVLAGGAEWVSDRTVDVALAAADSAGVDLACVSDDPAACADWVPFVANSTLALADADGLQTRYASFQDGFGNRTVTPVEDSVGLDREAPLDGTVEAVQSDDATLALSFVGYDDLTSGIVGYDVALAVGVTAPADCDTSVLGTVEDPSATASGLPFLGTVALRVCARDAAGLRSPGATAVVDLVDLSPPDPGVLLIDGGATATADASVELAFSATDLDAVTEVCVSEGATCADWQPYAGVATHTLPGPDGDFTLSAWFRDPSGNISAPVQASIRLDTTAPTDGAFSTQGVGDGSIQLEWADFADTGVGLREYAVVWAAGAAPSDCSGAGAEGTATLPDPTVELLGLVNGAVYGVRVCAVDAVGNVSAGISTAARPLPEADAPVDGVLSLAGGAAYAGSATVAVSATADDASGLGRVCFSTDPAACTDWEAFTGSHTFTFESVEATYSLYAWFEDIWGFQSAAPVSDDITLDLTAPADGVLTATPIDDNTVSLSWAGFSDDASGIASYVVRASSAVSGGTAPASCDAGTAVYTGSATAATITGLPGGNTHRFRVCALDAVGNRSAGVTAAALTSDTEPPLSPSVVINAGAVGTRSTSVTLSLSATDDSGVTQVCVSNTTTCTSWTAFTSTRAHTLATTGNPRTVYATFRDAFGNTSARVSDTILVDTTAPTNPTVTVSPVVGTNTVNWTAATDTLTGISGYKLVFRTGGTNPANACTTGTVLYQGTATSFTHTGLTRGTVYRYRVCAIDGATNTSSGGTAIVTGL